MVQVDVVQRRPGHGDGQHGTPAASSPASTAGSARARRRPGPAAPARPGCRTCGAPGHAPARPAGRSASSTQQRVPAQPALELLRGALGHDPAAVDDRQPVGEPVGLLQVVGGEQDGRPSSRGQPAISAHSSARASGSSPVVGSSRNSTGGVVHQARSRRRACAACRRTRCAPAGRPRRPARNGPAARGAGPQRGAAQPVQVALQQQVLAAGGLRVDRVLLEHAADRPADRVRLPVHVVAGDDRGAAGRLGQGGEDLDGGGLAGAVGAEQAEHGAGRDGEADAPHRPDVPG